MPDPLEPAMEQNAVRQLQRKNQQLAEALAHAAGFLEGLASRIDAWHRFSQMPTLPSSAADCRALAASLRKAADMQDIS
jgi:hypothetical protein